MFIIFEVSFWKYSQNYSAFIIDFFFLTDRILWLSNSYPVIKCIATIHCNELAKFTAGSNFCAKWYWGWMNIRVIYSHLFIENCCRWTGVWTRSNLNIPISVPFDKYSFRDYLSSNDYSYNLVAKVSFFRQVFGYQFDRKRDNIGDGVYHWCTLYRCNDWFEKNWE